MGDLAEVLQRIATLSRSEIGETEEDIRSNIVIPLFRALGHEPEPVDIMPVRGMNRTMVLGEGIPNNSRIILWIGSYSENPGRDLERVGLYAFQQGALLVVFVNGEEIRIYDPFLRIASFEDRLLYSIKRRDLSNLTSAGILKRLLSRSSLSSGKAGHLVEERGRQIVLAYSRAVQIQQEIAELCDKRTRDKEQIAKQIAQLQRQLDGIDEELVNLRKKATADINRLRARLGLPNIKSWEMAREEPAPSETKRLTRFEIRRAKGSSEVRREAPRRVHGGRNVYSHTGRRIEILLGNDTAMRFKLIPLSKSIRHLFPGYLVEFDIITDAGTIPCKVTSGWKDSKVGDPRDGKYITSVERNALRDWFRSHTISVGDTLVLEIVEPKKQYRLSILKQHR